ncbi:MAG TPA: hypothetical protein VJ418_35720 [Streptosporangiaceae bacterium]|nr:hypothetical protein [Streptosporangiaceae bacterium]
MAETEEHRKNSLANKARTVLSDDRLKQAAAVTKTMAVRAEGASRTVSRKVAQEDAWDELRGDAELLTEIARAHQAMIIDLVDRVAELEARAGGGDGS